ncbi:SRPBCC family protein [Streptomyces sp. NPDC048623]|uniref:SRPBCC family protein n=1 Tax=Streptomyces sp. NPDC048623 TaxID=3155761 RepID=UPI003438E639
MSTLEEQIDVNAPIDKAWGVLHRPETYPQYIDGVRSAEPRGDRGAHLSTDRGRTREYDATITDTDRGQERTMRWETADPRKLSGSFSLRAVDADHTQVQARVVYDPDAVRGDIGGPKTGIAQASAMERVVRADLEHFKDVVEHRR